MGDKTQHSPTFMLTLGIESSCDDTGVAVLKGSTQLLSNIVSNQDQIHARFGGIVPELASRRHLEMIDPLVKEALAQAQTTLDDVDLIAVTQGPGLIGSLLVGFSYAKALSYITNIPYIGVDHMSGHLLSVFLEEDKPQFPYIALIISGGTSSIYIAKSYNHFTLIGRTKDDAAGEAFDKVAKLLGFEYPGGPIISKYAEQGNTTLPFPRAWLAEDSFDFSFSGLKTAVFNYCNREKQMGTPLNINDICASFQEAVVDVLIEKTILASKKHNIDTIVLGGGVSANQRIREVFSLRCQQEKKTLYLPSPSFCTDNGAIIALAGYFQYTDSDHCFYDQDVYTRSKLG